MKKLHLNLILVLLTLSAALSGCSKTDVTPQQPAAAAKGQDATITAFLVKSYLFVRLPGPFNLGHTAVGYEVREMSGSTVTKVYTYCGGVENPGGSPLVPVGGYNGGWLNYDLNSNASMLNRMRSRNYTAYKFETAFRSVPQAWLNQASNILQYFPYRGYSVAENNCSDATYQVLAQLDARGLVSPYYNWAPKDQYNKTVTGWSSSRAL
jgi:hypothetical protein